MNQPKLIGIRFADNDFGVTLHSFLANMLAQGLDTYEISKENIVNLFNKSAPGLYYLIQNRMRYQEQFKPDEYLKISVDNVYFDQEVKDHLKEVGNWDNGEFHILDVKAEYIYNV